MNKAPCAKCDTCPLVSQPFVGTLRPAESDGTVLIGQAPGYQEARAGEPFVGPSGDVLRREYARAGGDFSRATLMNVVACEPPGDRPPTQNEIDHCAGRVAYELKQYAPTKTIVMGQIARKAIGELTGVLADEGVWNGTTIATVHPALLFRQPQAIKRLKRALERAVRGPGGDDIESLLQQPPEVTVIESRSQLVEVLTAIPDRAWVAFDLETDQTIWYRRDQPLDDGQTAPDSVLCVAFTTGVGYGWIVPDYLIYDCEGVPALLSEFFARVQTIGHNGKFDVLFTGSVGIRTHIDFDTMAAHYVLDESPGTHGLKELASVEFGVPDYEAKLTLKYLKSKNDRYSKIAELPLYTYATWDVCTTIALAMKFKEEMVRQRLWEHPFQSLMMPGLRCLTNVERRGIRVDIPYLKLWRERLLARAEVIRKQMCAWAGADFNPGSHVQMKRVLFQTLKLPITQPVRQASGRGTTKLGSTGKDALVQLKGLHPIIALIGEYRTCLKMVRSYVNNLLRSADEFGRVHTSYSMTTTVTGRLASRNPALQQIPKGRSLYGQIIRAAFIPAPGKVLIDCDYAQAELRVFAAETKDPFLINVYENDLDLHEQVVISQWGPVEQMTEMEYENRRFIAKIFNFGWAYGGGADMLEGVVPDHATAARFVKQYEANMPVAARWRQQRAYEAQNRGYVQSRLGRRRRAIGGELKPTEAINAPIQSGASDCTVKAAIRLDNEGYDVILLVHDQLLVECDEDKAEETLEYVAQVMAEEAAKIYPEVPWKADGKIKRRWAKELTPEQVEDWLECLVTPEDDETLPHEDLGPEEDVEEELAVLEVV